MNMMKQLIKIMIQKLCFNNFGKQLGMVVNVINQNLGYITNDGEHNKLEYKLYSTATLPWIKN